MEKLGVGPDECLKRNPGLVYGRLTGWGQEGPLSHAAGHDINYIALSGALHAIGRQGEKPTIPINLLGDFGGGCMLQAFGIVCALLEAQKSGRGQVVDTAMVDGAAALMAVFFGLHSGGLWSERGTNILDGGAHFYNTYETSDGKYVAVGSIEPKFYAQLIRLTGIEDPDFRNQMDMNKWPGLKQKLAGVFRSRTRQEWSEAMEGTDACFAPVLSFDEAINHPHNAARKTFVDIEGVVQPAPTPRFSRTKCEIACYPSEIGADTESALADWGFDPSEIHALKEAGAI
jgi:alpha-methylacyl-CoA racemase